MELISWVTFFVLLIGLLWFDLAHVNKKSHVIGTREALMQSAFWIVIALLFGGFVWFTHGHDAAFQYYNAYLVEKLLSVDNLAVFVMIFTYFRTPAEYQHRVLYLGIISALVMRGIFLGAGVVLVSKFHWILYLFGAFLVYSGIKLCFASDDEAEEIQENAVVKGLRKIFPVYDYYDGLNFTKFINGVLHLTPLAIVLVMIETSDILFAFDSIPAVLSVSQNMFVVFTSNMFALLGLRSLYFALASMMDNFCYLKYGISIVLSFIGLKMLIADFVHIETWLSLVITVLILSTSVIASLIKPAKSEEPII